MEHILRLVRFFSLLIVHYHLSNIIYQPRNVISKIFLWSNSRSFTFDFYNFTILTKLSGRSYEKTIVLLSYRDHQFNLISH